jgi:hypothetical protein
MLRRSCITLMNMLSNFLRMYVSFHFFYAGMIVLAQLGDLYLSTGNMNRETQQLGIKKSYFTEKFC